MSDLELVDELRGEIKTQKDINKKNLEWREKELGDLLVKMTSHIPLSIANAPESDRYAVGYLEAISKCMGFIEEAINIGIDRKCNHLKTR